MQELPALPENYAVSRKTPSARESKVYVLDYVHDYPARVALVAFARTALSIGQKDVYDAVMAELAATQDQYQVFIESKNPKVKAKKSKRM